MKKILLMMAVVFLAISANAQTNEQEEASKSEAVKLLQKDGVLLRKDFYDIGKVEGVTFQNIIITTYQQEKRQELYDSKPHTILL